MYLTMNINDEDRDSRYKLIYSHRHVRSNFIFDPISNDVLKRTLQPVHQVPSAGFIP